MRGGPCARAASISEAASGAGGGGGGGGVDGAEGIDLTAGLSMEDVAEVKAVLVHLTPPTCTGYSMNKQSRMHARTP